MNTDALKRMSYETLQKLKEAIEKEMVTRKDFSIRVGRTGYFVSNGTKIFVRVTRINPKSLTVKPIDPDSKHLGWRIGRSMIVMDGVEIVGAEPIRRATPSTSPSVTYNVDAW